MKSENLKDDHSRFPADHWKGKVSNYLQLGGIETAILDNGNGRGVRIAWINTGSGLRFKVVLDRGMDIADAFFSKYNLAWISHMGVKPPNPAAVSGANWLHSFGGGLLTTCGLTHVGGPEEDDFGERGLHDRISHSPAQLISVKQPDLKSGDLTMSLTGKMIQSTTFGPHLELKRTISATLGSPVINIRDEVTNTGNEPAPHMLLYHCNFGWPLIDDGTEILWEGDLEVPNDQSRKIFNEGSDYKVCRNPIEDHSGSGEAVGFIDIRPDSRGQCVCSVHNHKIGLKLGLTFQKEQLKWLTNWQHWGRNEYVTALEPCTNPPIGQAAARKNKTLIFIGPGETKLYNLEMNISSV
ncbi:MAG: aldose 1-epimerase family protein [Balneolaceae bacterium]